VLGVKKQLNDIVTKIRMTRLGNSKVATLLRDNMRWPQFNSRPSKATVCATVAILVVLSLVASFGTLGTFSVTSKDAFLPVRDFYNSENEEGGHSVVKREAQRFGVSGGRLGGKTSFSLKDIVNNEYAAERWNGTWVSDDEFAYRNRDGDLALLSISTSRTQILVPADVMLQPERVFKFWISPDKRFVMLAIRPQKLFRHSFIAMYDIYDVEKGRRTPLQPDLGRGRGGGGGGGGFGNQDGPGRAGPQRPQGGGGGGRRPPQQLPLMYATWSPTGHSLAYVFANNIYYRATPSSPDFPVTESGIPGSIFNGVCDWVYEEEVISDTRALWFSPDSNHIAWIEFNDTLVETMPLQVYGPPGRLDFQYPIPTPLRYPKPGRANPLVNVYVSDVRPSSDGRSQLLEAPSYFDDKQKIIYGVTWATKAEVSLTWESRHQNYTLVSICDVTARRGPECKDSLVMTETAGWMEVDQPPVFTEDGRRFALILSSEGYKHVNVINRETNQRVPITSGEMVVLKIYFWDEVNHLIYFRATAKGGAGERHLYTVTDFESGRPGVVDCLSCDVKNTRGGDCNYNSFDFSEGKEHSYYTMSCKGPHVPQDYLFQTSPNRKVGTLVTNSRLNEDLLVKHLPKVSNLDVPIANGRYMAKVRLYLPHDFNNQKKYPLLVNVYAGPNSQQVNDRFKLDWGTYLATTEDVIYAVIDGRGSGYRGDDLLFEIYYKLGGPEVQDQIDVTRQLVNQYSFIDRSNVAIWGWSYGGFVTASVLAADADGDNVFKCGISVAPVTNWIYYDTIYTERYMGLPLGRDNLQGYKDSDVTAKAAKLKNKKFLIVHGTADDNVHYQQSMMLTRALEEADVLFQQLSYPDEDHGIVGLRRHFYHALSNFILNDCFNRNQVL